METSDTVIGQFLSIRQTAERGLKNPLLSFLNFPSGRIVFVYSYLSKIVIIDEFSLGGGGEERGRIAHIIFPSSEQVYGGKVYFW